MSEITEGKYKGLDTTYQNTIINQGGTPVSSKLIFTSESSTNNVQLFDACNIDWSGYKIGDTYIKYTGDLIENLGNVAGISNISVDENNNSLTADGVQYTLTIDDNGVLRFQNYSEITLSGVTSSKSFEYKSGSQTFTVSATPSKNCIVTNRWEDDSTGNSYSANATISASVTSFGDTSYTLTVKETDKNATKTATVNVNYNQIEFCVFGSTNNNLTISGTYQTKPSQYIQSNNFTHYNKKLYTIGATSFSLTLSSINDNEYLYLLIPSNIANHFYVGGSNMAEESSDKGSAIFYGDKNYKLYKCGDSPGNTSVKN